MRVTLYYLLVLYGFCSGCKGTDEYSQEGVHGFIEQDFTEKKKIQGQLVRLNEAVVPTFIKIIPEYNILVTIEMSTDDFFGKVFSMDSLKYIKSFINKGVKESEQLSAFGIHYDKEQSMLYVPDLHKNQVFGYSVDTLSCPTCLSVPDRIINRNQKQLIKPISISTSRIVDIHLNKNVDSVSSLAFYDSDGALLKLFGDFPAYKKKRYDPRLLISIYAGWLNLSDDRSKILRTYDYMDFIDVYDTTANLIKRLKGPYNTVSKFDKVDVGNGSTMIPDKKAKRTYASKAYMKESLLVLYNGKAVNQRDIHADRLFQFDGNFNPETIYQLDHPIFTFDIDWDTGTIFGLNDSDKN